VTGGGEKGGANGLGLLERSSFLFHGKKRKLLLARSAGWKGECGSCRPVPEVRTKRRQGLLYGWEEREKRELVFTLHSGGG